MTEDRSNPFASPDMELEESVEANRIQPASAGRWIGLSALSGFLLFGGYSILITALAEVAFLTLVAGYSMQDIPHFSITIAIRCVVAAAVGGAIGTCLGITLGVISFWRRHLSPLGLISVVALILSGTAAIGLVVAIGSVAESGSLGFLMFCVAVAAIFGLGTLHLVVNIHRFLLKPLQEAGA